MNKPKNATLAPALDFADRSAVRAWLDDVAVCLEDLGSAAEDQAAPPDDRTLGPAMARELIGDAYGALVQLVAFARAGLDWGSPQRPAPPAYRREVHREASQGQG